MDSNWADIEQFLRSEGYRNDNTIMPQIHSSK